MKSADTSARPPSDRGEVGSQRLPSRRCRGTCLHDGRMQIQVVRHHRGAEDADRDVASSCSSGCCFADEPACHFNGRQYAASHSSTAKHPAIARMRPTTSASDAWKPRCWQQHDDHVERRDADAPDHGDAKQQVEGDGGTDDLREVAGGDGVQMPSMTVVRRGSCRGHACARSRPEAMLQSGGEGLQQDRQWSKSSRR